MATPAAQWKRQEAQTLKLPSGNSVDVYEADILGMIMSGDNEDVPDFITAQVMRGVSGTKTKAPNLDITPDKLPEFGQFIDRVVRAGVVSPHVVVGEADYDAGQISIDDLTFADKFLIFQVVMPQGEAQAAITFRQRVEKANMGVVDYRENGGGATEPTTEDTE